MQPYIGTIVHTFLPSEPSICSFFRSYFSASIRGCSLRLSRSPACFRPGVKIEICRLLEIRVCESVTSISRVWSSTCSPCTPTPPCAPRRGRRQRRGKIEQTPRLLHAQGIYSHSPSHFWQQKCPVVSSTLRIRQISVPDCTSVHSSFSLSLVIC